MADEGSILRYKWRGMNRLMDGCLRRTVSMIRHVYNLTVCLTKRHAGYPAMSLSPKQYKDFHEQLSAMCTVSCRHQTKTAVLIVSVNAPLGDTSPSSVCEL